MHGWALVCLVGSVPLVVGCPDRTKQGPLRGWESSLEDDAARGEDVHSAYVAACKAQDWNELRSHLDRPLRESCEAELARALEAGLKRGAAIDRATAGHGFSRESDYQLLRSSWTTTEAQLTYRVTNRSGPEGGTPHRERVYLEVVAGYWKIVGIEALPEVEPTPDE